MPNRFDVLADMLLAADSGKMTQHTQPELNINEEQTMNDKPFDPIARLRGMNPGVRLSSPPETVIVDDMQEEQEAKPVPMPEQIAAPPEQRKHFPINCLLAGFIPAFVNPNDAQEVFTIPIPGVTDQDVNNALDLFMSIRKHYRQTGYHIFSRLPEDATFDDASINFGSVTSPAFLAVGVSPDIVDEVYHAAGLEPGEMHGDLAAMQASPAAHIEDDLSACDDSCGLAEPKFTIFDSHDLDQRLIDASEDFWHVAYDFFNSEGLKASLFSKFKAAPAVYEAEVVKHNMLVARIRAYASRFTMLPLDLDERMEVEDARRAFLQTLAEAYAGVVHLPDPSVTGQCPILKGAFAKAMSKLSPRVVSHLFLNFSQGSELGGLFGERNTLGEPIVTSPAAWPLRVSGDHVTDSQFQRLQYRHMYDLLFCINDAFAREVAVKTVIQERFQNMLMGATFVSNT